MTSETHPSSAAKPGDDPGSSSPAASRRAFLTGAGAAAAGVTALGAGLVGAAPADAATVSQEDHQDHEQGDAAQQIVAYISDPATGEITVMSGEREVTVTDHRLTQAFARKVR